MEQNRYLIVDDEAVIRDLLSSYFEKYGIKSDVAANAAEARKLLAVEDYDLVTLDVVMPGESGIELTKWIKAEKRIPVILLTSLDDPADTVTGLEIGADDYVSKPFDARILLARTKAVLRRYENSDPSTSDKFLLYINESVLNMGGVKYHLNSSELSLLELLIAADGKPVPRGILSIEMFGREWNPDDRTIDNIVARLRSKLEPSRHVSKYIITVRNRGYMVEKGVFESVRGF